MKILIVMPLAELRGGGEISLVHLIRQGRSPELGVEWVVAFLEEGPLAAVLAGFGVKTYTVPSGKLRQPHRYAAAVGRLAGIIKRERPDVALGWMGHAELYAGPAAMLAGIPTLWYQLGTPNPDHKLDKIALRLSTYGVLVNSRHCYDIQATLTPRKPVRLVYPGVELERFDPAGLPPPEEARRQLGLPASGPIIGNVGRLQRWKGMHTLIEAMPAILAESPDATCVIVGGEHKLEPGYERVLEKLIHDLGAGGSVILAGLQSNVPLWMQAMDVVTHTSSSEPFGIVVLEAMSLGKPVVAGAEGGPAEIVTDGVNGVLAPYEDHARLAEVILAYLRDPAMAKRVGAAARARAQEFSEQRFAANLVGAVRELMTLPAVRGISGL